MADNLRWFKVWTSITDDPDFLDMSLEDIGRWVLLGAYIAKHGEKGFLQASNAALKQLLRCDEISTVLKCIHNVNEEMKNDNGKVTVSLKNWHKYQVDSSGYERLKKFRERQNDNGARGEERRGDKTKTKKRKEVEEKNDVSDEPKPPTVKLKMSDEEWRENLKSNPAYKGLDIEKAYGKMLVWCDTNGKYPTRRRFVNWLNREEQPMEKGGFEIHD